MVKYTMGGLPEFKKSAKETALLIPLTSSLNNFPAVIKERVPGIYSVFKNIYQKVKSDSNTAEPLFFVIERNSINLVFCICIGDDNQLSYYRLFETITQLEKSGDYLLFTMQEFLDTHVASFEALEYDLETNFGKSDDIEIIIVNKESEVVNDA